MSTAVPPPESGAGPISQDRDFQSNEVVPVVPDRREVVARQKEEFGGMKLGSAFFGWLAATGMAVLLTALVAGAGEQSGVVIVAGTGSIAYGVDASKRACRAGGWGYLLGDEGGGYWIGRAALSAVVRAFDGRGPATRLTELVLAEMHLATPSDLIHAIYDRGLQRPLLAGLAAVVQEAMLAGDAVASDILARAAEELVGAAASVVTRLGMRGDVFPTILAGGIFRAMPALSADVCQRMSEVAPRSEVRSLDVEPARGAVTLALAAAGGTLLLPSYI